MKILGSCLGTLERKLLVCFRPNSSLHRQGEHAVASLNGLIVPALIPPELPANLTVSDDRLIY